MHISIKGSNGSDLISVSEFLSLDYFEGIRTRHLEHQHTKSWEFICCLQGRIRVFRNDTWLNVDENQFVLLAPGSRHDVVTDLPFSVFLLCNFVCSNDSLLSPTDGYVMTVDKFTDRLMSSIKYAVSSLSRNVSEGSDKQRIDIHTSGLPAGSEQMMRLQLEQILIRAIRIRGDLAGINTDNAGRFWKTNDYLIDRINDYIAYHYNEKLTVQEIAELFSYSRSRLSNIYITATGKSISSEITETRIKAALDQINNGATNIKAIAESCGFRTQQYFSKVFASCVGVSPSVYIKKQIARRDSEDI